MRFVVCSWLLLGACAGHGQSPPPTDAVPPLPVACEGRCIADDPGDGPVACCDSVTCFLDASAHEWVVVFCDPPLDPCVRCGIDQLCVQTLDGGCNLATACVDRVVDCPDNACSPACEAAYCAAPAQCQNRIPCGGESSTAFTCYGP